ncbi:YceD family protein [Sphingobium aquiterrae]|uniref:YceD family protein n=1 Tax=Sphingobium aquiterrae TaxID=2038656 RepID=UPI003AFB0343
MTPPESGRPESDRPEPGRPELSRPELSRIVRLDQAHGNAAGTTISADEGERAALVRRFGLSSLDRLEADYRLIEENGVLVARGQLRATLAQPCVATGEPVPETIDTPFAIRFLRETDAAPQEEETELDEEDCDTMFFSGEAIDIGEAVAQTLSLSLTPYPRAPDADDYLRKMGVLKEEQASPFAALLGLKGMGKGED